LGRNPKHGHLSQDNGLLASFVISEAVLVLVTKDQDSPWNNVFMKGMEGKAACLTLKRGVQVH
jgi:hypothetical protein